MEQIPLSPNIYACSSCPNRCDGRSKGEYIFEDDVKLSESYEDKIIRYINSKGVYKAVKTKTKGYPDIEVYTKEGVLKEFIEIKVQQRTFMKVADRLPLADLCPSESLGLNRSDLERYIELFDSTAIPISIAWVLFNRPCILRHDPYKVYVQKIVELQKIFKKYGDKRTFRRRSGKGDVVDKKHKGVVVNYHFSLNELKEWRIHIQ